MRTAWITGALVVGAGAVVALAVPAAAPAVLIGIAGPLVVATGSLVAMDRAYRRSPELVSGLMLRLFLGKIVAFGLYVALAIAILSLDPIWFIGSFTVSFVAFHLAEAMHLQRLYSN
ncbi:MAG: hypothetical protein F4Z04_17105 [Acidobacteria bacterium]|nr:hypothetical protein [Acidobacteriota bacterium]